MVTVPLGVTEDKLLGTIDVERLLKDGVQVFQPGLMARANNQVLYVDEVNLLPDNITDDILDACAGGYNTVEREGVSVTHPARFILVGTMNPEEGNLRPQILDRFAMSVRIDTEMNPMNRIEIIERNLAWETDPERFSKAFGRADERLRKTIAAAKRRLDGVRLPVAVIETVAGAMSDLRVDGQRPDLVTIRAARAWTALEDIEEVSLEALRSVAPLCVCHRTRSGGMNQPPEKDELIEALEKSASSSKSHGKDLFDPEKVLAQGER
jgi:Mg-chelatase subunit ChlI